MSFVFSVLTLRSPEPTYILLNHDLKQMVSVRKFMDKSNGNLNTKYNDLSSYRQMLKDEEDLRIGQSMD